MNIFNRLYTASKKLAVICDKVHLIIVKANFFRALVRVTTIFDIVHRHRSNGDDYPLMYRSVTSVPCPNVLAMAIEPP
jgi:hypothetical protein